MSSYDRHRSRSRSPLSRPRKQHPAPGYHQQQYDGSDHSSYHWSSKWKQDQWTNNNWSESWSTDSWSNTFKDGSPFPASWKPDADHLDTNEVHGLAMGRRVAKTAWSSDKGLRQIARGHQPCRSSICRTQQLVLPASLCGSVHQYRIHQKRERESISPINS